MAAKTKKGNDSGDKSSPKNKPRERAAHKKGILSAKTYGGLNKDRLARGGGPRLQIKTGETKTVQFLDSPQEMEEYDVHSVRERKNFFYVPCVGEDCPLCEDEDDDVSYQRYRACANVWSFSDNAVKVLEGPQEIFGKIKRRADAKKQSFFKRTWDLSKVNGKRVSWDMDQGDEDAIDPKPLQKKKHDLKKFIQSAVDRFYADANKSTKKKGKSALDDDDYEEDDATYTKKDLAKMSDKELRKVAKALDVRPDKTDPKITIKRILKAQAA